MKDFFIFPIVKRPAPSDFRASMPHTPDAIRAGSCGFLLGEEPKAGR